MCRRHTELHSADVAMSGALHELVLNHLCSCRHQHNVLATLCTAHSAHSCPALRPVFESTDETAVIIRRFDYGEQYVENNLNGNCLCGAVECMGRQINAG